MWCLADILVLGGEGGRWLSRIRGQVGVWADVGTAYHSPDWQEAADALQVVSDQLVWHDWYVF